MFFDIASHALRQFNIKHRFFHLDTTTVSLHGEYNSKADEVDETRVIKITKGLSKDNAPELNQVVASLMTTSDIDWLSAKEEWKALRSIIMIRGSRTLANETTVENRFLYLLS